MVKRDKKGHYLKIKGSIHQEYRTIVNIYLPSIGGRWSAIKWVSARDGMYNMLTVAHIAVWYIGKLLKE